MPIAEVEHTIVGAAGDGDCDYRAWHYEMPMILFMGSEGHGLTQAQRELCDRLVSIPMRGQNDSLNLAVATGVILYEVLAQTV